MKSFRKDALLGKELKFYEEQNIIDNARIKAIRSPNIKGKIKTVKESTMNLTKEIDEYQTEMSDDEYKEYRQSKVISKQEIKEPIEYSLLRNSIMAALSSASDESNEAEFEEEEEDISTTEASEVSINLENESSNQKNHSPILKKSRTPNQKTFSMTNFYQTYEDQSNSRANSTSMKYEDLMTSFESPLNPPETNRAIEIADKVRVKLYSPFMTKRNLQPSLPQNLSLAAVYRTPQNSKTYKTSNNQNNINYSSIYHKTSNRQSPFSTPHKTVTDINGVTEHVQRLRRAKQINSKTKEMDEDFDEFQEFIIPDKPIITPNTTKLANLFSKEIDKVLEETEHSILEQDI